MATQDAKATNFIDIDIDVVGPLGFKLDGYDDGTSISLAPQGDGTTVRVGNDGLGVFASKGTPHEIWTIVFLENSDAVDKIDAWFQAKITQSITFRDGSSRTVLSGQARPRQTVTITKSAGVETRTVDIHVLGVTGRRGGLNNP